MLEPVHRLGDLLIQKRFASPRQVEAALALQASSGGRIGSLLVKGGLVTERQVSETLAEQHGVLAADPAVLERIAPGALGAVPSDLCARHAVLPFALIDGTLHLAMRDPQQIDVIDRLGRALGVTIQPYAVPELRLYHWLEVHYQIPRPACYRPQAAPRPAAPGLRRVESWAAAPASRPAPPAAPATARASDEPELVYLDQFDFSASTPDPESLEVEIDVSFDGEVDVNFDGEVDVNFDGDEAPARAATVADLVAQLDRATDRERVIALLLRPPIETVTLSVVLLPRGELVRALGAWGTPLSPADVRRLVLPLVGGSLLRQAFDTQQVICGPASEDTVQPMIASYLRAPLPQQACVAPVCVGPRVVNLLCYQSNGSFVADDATRFSRLAEATARAYRRLIAQQKRS
jgi:type IV pilus assembly protein PilB